VKRIAPEWNDVLLQCGVKPRTAAIWSEIFAAVIGKETFSAGDSEMDDFLGQVLHESAMLERLEENLSYSPERLTQVWPSRFPTVEAAQPYARNPEALANNVYRNRLGNNERGDGWRYKGRGLIQCTGKSNYAAVARLTGIDCLNNPELLAQPMQALQSAVAWWEEKIPDEVMGHITKVTRVVNGGQHGLAHRDQLTQLAGDALAQKAST
jgi:putative chitinase